MAEPTKIKVSEPGRHAIVYGRVHRFLLHGEYLNKVKSVELKESKSGVTWERVEHMTVVAPDTLHFESKASHREQGLKRDGDGTITVTLNPSPGSSGTTATIPSYYSGA